MAKKNFDSKEILGFGAFAALIVKAACLILAYFKVSLGIFATIADIILSIVVLVVAWQFAKKCDKVWKIVYLVVALLIVLFYVLAFI